MGIRRRVLWYRAGIHGGPRGLCDQRAAARQQRRRRPHQRAHLVNLPVGLMPSDAILGDLGSGASGAAAWPAVALPGRWLGDVRSGERVRVADVARRERLPAAAAAGGCSAGCSGCGAAGGTDICQHNRTQWAPGVEILWTGGRWAACARRLWGAQRWKATSHVGRKIPPTAGRWRCLLPWLAINDIRLPCVSGNRRDQNTVSDAK